MNSPSSEEEEDDEDEPPPATKMGFYETVASAQASADNGNRRAFRVSVNKPELHNLLDSRENSDDSVHVAAPMTTPHTAVKATPSDIRLPRITNTAIIANSASPG